MKDILDDIMEYKKIEVEQQKQNLPPAELYRRVEQMKTDASLRPRRSMSRALASSDTGIIAEFKRRSPSKGWINESASLERIAGGYALNGASALSVLTDEKYFGGNLDFLRTVASMVDVPVLRKDFIIDEYQLFQAYEAGADAVLLIASCLSRESCMALASKAHELGMEVLLEIHSADELGHLDCGADMVGVNNRNLGTFHTDVNNSFALAELLPKDSVLVSESGISDPKTICQLQDAGYSGFLIGETFMKTADPAESLLRFVDEIRQCRKSEKPC